MEGRGTVSVDLSAVKAARPLRELVKTAGANFVYRPVDALTKPERAVAVGFLYQMAEELGHRGDMSRAAAHLDKNAGFLLLSADRSEAVGLLLFLVTSPDHWWEHQQHRVLFIQDLYISPRFRGYCTIRRIGQAVCALAATNKDIRRIAWRSIRGRVPLYDRIAERSVIYEAEV